MQQKEAEELLEKKLAFIDYVNYNGIGLYIDGRLVQVPVHWSDDPNDLK